MLLNLCAGHGTVLGVQNAGIEVYEDAGKIDDAIADDDFEAWDAEQSQITEGSRNSTMSRYAGRIINRLGYR